MLSQSNIYDASNKFTYEPYDRNRKIENIQETTNSPSTLLNIYTCFEVNLSETIDNQFNLCYGCTNYYNDRPFKSLRKKQELCQSKYHCSHMWLRRNITSEEEEILNMQAHTIKVDNNNKRKRSCRNLPQQSNDCNQSVNCHSDSDLQESDKKNPTRSIKVRII
jgi:hypothetical protein